MSPQVRKTHPPKKHFRDGKGKGRHVFCHTPFSTRRGSGVFNNSPMSLLGLWCVWYWICDPGCELLQVNSGRYCYSTGDPRRVCKIHLQLTYALKSSPNYNRPTPDAPVCSLTLQRLLSRWKPPRGLDCWGFNGAEKVRVGGGRQIRNPENSGTWISPNGFVICQAEMSVSTFFLLITGNTCCSLFLQSALHRLN